MKYLIHLPALLAWRLSCQQPATTTSPSAKRAKGNDVPRFRNDADKQDMVGRPSRQRAALAHLHSAQYRGRWGMVSADCTSTRGDAKGLITINEVSIKFYEARATLKEQRPAVSTSFSGLYGFVGEGQTWEKVVTLTRTGDALKRADDEGSYNYERCA